MTDDLIARLASDLKPLHARTMQHRLALAIGAGLALTLFAAWIILGFLGGRPFGASYGSPMFWTKGIYALAFGLLGLSAIPALARPDGRIVWPLATAALLVPLALGLGTMGWIRQDWAMADLVGQTALVCPWLITLTSLPLLAVLLGTMRQFAPRSPMMAGLAAGLVAGGFGAAIYALFCAETGMMFMAVWYSLGIAIMAMLGAVLGQRLLRW